MNADSSTGPRWRGLATAAGFVFLLAVGAPGTTMPGHAQANWPFHLEWTHDGGGVAYFQLCASEQCAALPASPVGNGGWRAPLPVLAPGEHRLVVEACGYSECVPGKPDLVIRVLEPSGRRPPIDVVSGPRVEVGAR